MGGIEDDRASGLAHDGQTAHVRDQIVVAKGCAALADHDGIGASAASRALATTLRMSAGARNCPFLMFTGLPEAATALDEIGLPAKESRRLQDIDNAGDSGDVFLAMHIGQHRNANLAAHLREDAADPRRRPGHAPSDPSCGWPCRRRP
jgi:hypothetical protein